jgi:hypothetical protein
MEYETHLITIFKCLDTHTKLNDALLNKENLSKKVKTMLNQCYNEKYDSFVFENTVNMLITNNDIIEYKTNDATALITKRFFEQLLAVRTIANLKA